MADRNTHQRIVQLLAGMAAALLITGLAFRLHFNLSSATSVHFLLVTVIALRWGFFEASVISLLSVACLDYFFTEPLFQLYMIDAHDWVALILFESVALVVSRLSTQLSQHARAVEVHDAHLQRLYAFSQGTLLLDGREPIEQQLAALIQTTFRVKGVALWNGYDHRASLAGECPSTERALCSSFESERSEDDTAAGVSWRVLRSGTRAIGSLILYGHSLDAATLNATASLTAVAMERARSFRAESNAEAARQGEQLRSAILDGLAHAFKTPLTTLKSCSSGLIELERLSGTEQRLILLMDAEITRLSELTTRVLRTAKLDMENLQPKRKRIEITSLAEETIRDMAQQLGQRPVAIHSQARMKYVWADTHLLKMALCQLVDNAAKYSSPDSKITIEIAEEEAEVLLSVHNHGSFIPQPEQTKIFQRFYRSPGTRTKAPGTGIGLSVVKQITEAHHGRAWVSSDGQTGTTFFLSLPRLANEES